MKPGEVIEQVKTTRDYSREVQHQVCYHDDICLEAGDSSSPFEIWVQHIALDRLGQLTQGRGVPELEHHGIEVRMGSIVHVMNLLGCFFSAQFWCWGLRFGFA